MKNKKLVFDLDYTLYSPVLYPEENYVSNPSGFKIKETIIYGDDDVPAENENFDDLIA